MAPVQSLAIRISGKFWRKVQLILYHHEHKIVFCISISNTFCGY